MSKYSDTLHILMLQINVVNSGRGSGSCKGQVQSKKRAISACGFAEIEEVGS